MTQRASRTALTLAALLATAGAGAGCGPEFDPYERLTSLRILAMRSEPVTPAIGETTVLDALVYSPPVDKDLGGAGLPVSYEWSWCPLVGSSNTGSPCLISEEQLNSMTGQTVSFALGTAEKASFTNNIPPELFKQICAGLPDLPAAVDCRDGFPITIRLTVRTDGDEVTSIRPLRLRFEDTHQANSNPMLGPLTRIKGMEMMPLDDENSVKLARRTDNDLSADVSPDNAQEYQGLNDDLKEDTLTERLFLSWFVESGDLKFARTAYNKASGVDFMRFLKNVWRPDILQRYPRQSSKLYVALRDNREGVDWKVLSVSLEDFQR